MVIVNVYVYNVAAIQINLLGNMSLQNLSETSFVSLFGQHNEQQCKF